MDVRRLNNNELYHHGIKGQRWGVRRYQNEDGSLTDAGRKRYGTNAKWRTAVDHIDYSDKVNKKVNNTGLTLGMLSLSGMTAALPLMGLSMPAAVSTAAVSAGMAVALPAIKHIGNKKIKESEKSLLGIQKDLYKQIMDMDNLVNVVEDEGRAMDYYTAGNALRYVSKSIENNDPRNLKSELSLIKNENGRIDSQIKVKERKKEK